MNRHYKMFKKGKNWCYVAVATIAVLFGMATNSRVVKADISNNISPSLAQQVETDKVNSINKSEELQKTKKVNGLEISNIQLRETGGITTLLADVKNTTGAETEDKTVKVEILDKQGNVITRLLGPIDSIPSGGTVKLNVAVTADVANAYDFRISE